MDWKKYDLEQLIFSWVVIIWMAVCWGLVLLAVALVGYEVWEWACFDAEPHLFVWGFTLACVGWALKDMLKTKA